MASGTTDLCQVGLIGDHFPQGEWHPVERQDGNLGRLFLELAQALL